MDGTVGTLLAEQDVGWLEVTVYDARLRELRLVRVRVRARGRGRVRGRGRGRGRVRVGVRVRVRVRVGVSFVSCASCKY